MAHWDVIRSPISLFPHPGADNLELGKVGQYQVVCRKGEYQEGDEVVFIPEKSILPESIAEPFRNYLRGPEKNRVGSVRLRGELSMGICLSVADAERICGTLPTTNLAESLGIDKYEAPIPACLAGELERLDGLWSQHDVEQYGIYAGEFSDDEDVILTEKLHGSQIISMMNAAGEMFVSSKGVISRGLCIKESVNNTYWRAVRGCGLEDRLRDCLELSLGCKNVQIFGEVLPVQGAKWTYGFDPNKPTLRIFDVRVDGKSSALLRNILLDMWVPIILVAVYGSVRDSLHEFCAGMECVSGKGLHIREGIVMRPIADRYATDGTRLMVKVINPAYAKKETGEEIS